MSETLTMLSRLGSMFERTASVRDEADLQEVLQDVARAIGEVLGYRAVVVNVYRPAFDDMLTAAAVGSIESREQLLGTSSPNDTWTPLFADRFEHRGAYFILDGEFDWDSLGVSTYVPDLPPSDDPDAWLPGDALFVPLRDAGGAILGVISVDEPESGLRPSEPQLDALVTISRHAALALQIAQNTAKDVQHQRMLERVLEVSARLAEADDVEAVLQAVCDGIDDALGFDKVVIELAEGREGPLTPVAATGFGIDVPGIIPGVTLAALAPLFTEEFEVAGCYLLTGEVAEARLGAGVVPYRSALNGHGPHAWSCHWLMVPLIEGDKWIGLIWVDDPRDRLLPTRARLQALRLFANQAVSALRAADQATRLRHEATHDTLTGLPNRRAFRVRVVREIDEGDGFGLVRATWTISRGSTTRTATRPATTLFRCCLRRFAASCGAPTRPTGSAATSSPSSSPAQTVSTPSAWCTGCAPRSPGTFRRRATRSRPASECRSTSRATTPRSCWPAQTRGSIRQSAVARSRRPRARGQTRFPKSSSSSSPEHMRTCVRALRRAPLPLGLLVP